MSKDYSTASRLTARDMRKVSPWIDGTLAESQSESLFLQYDPATGAKLCEIPRGSAADADCAVSSARRSFESGAWRDLSPTQKKSVMNQWADLIERNADRFDALDALEMGKPVSLQAFNAKAAAAMVRFQAEASDKSGGDVLTTDAASTVIQKLVPRGVVAAIVPWNFPTYNAVLKVAPALAAGNSVVLKPSELSSQTAMTLSALAMEAGVPAGALNVVPGCGEIVGRALAEHMDVDMVTFTGSTEVGKLMLQYAGRSNLKMVSAECGGKSPHVVFNDGLDLQMVANWVASMITLNQGQVCSVGSRVLVQEEIADSFVTQIATCLRTIAPGDPQSPSTTFGPLVSLPQLERVQALVTAASDEGAELAYGGARLLEHTGGYFLEPTVFTNVPEASRIAQQEIFGPVLSVLRFRDFEHAVRLANGTNYGLATYVWTSRMDTGFRFGNRVNAGYTQINATSPTGEGPGLRFSGEPFGWSGVGVEGGVAGMESYMRRHTLWFNHG